MGRRQYSTNFVIVAEYIAGLATAFCDIERFHYTKGKHNMKFFIYLENGLSRPKFERQKPAQLNHHAAEQRAAVGRDTHLLFFRYAILRIRLKLLQTSQWAQT